MFTKSLASNHVVTCIVNACNISVLVISIVTWLATALPIIPFQLMIWMHPMIDFLSSGCLRGNAWRGRVVGRSTFTLKRGSFSAFSVFISQPVRMHFPAIPIVLSNSNQLKVWWSYLNIFWPFISTKYIRLSLISN